MKPLDDAGWPYTPVSLSSLGRDPRMVDPRFALMIERTYRAQLMQRNPRWIIAGALAILFPLAFIGALMLRLPIAFSLPTLIAIASVVVIVGRRKLGARSMLQVASVLVRHGVCAGCGYDIPRHNADPQLIRCPECACSWEASRIRPRDIRSDFAWGDKAGTNRSVSEFKSRASMFGPSLATDARGRSVPLVSTRLRAQLAAVPDGPYRLRLLKASESLRPAGRPLRICLGLLVAIWAVSQLTMALASPRGVRGVVRGMAMMVGPGLFGLMIVQSGLGTPRRVLIRMLLDNQLCPTCAADLSANMDESGMAANEIVCPDCGAAWQNESAATCHPPVA